MLHTLDVNDTVKILRLAIGFCMGGGGVMARTEVIRCARVDMSCNSHEAFSGEDMVTLTKCHHNYPGSCNELRSVLLVSQNDMGPPQKLQ